MQRTYPQKLLITAIFSMTLLGCSGAWGGAASGGSGPITSPGPALSYTIVDTGQTGCHDNLREFGCPDYGQPFYGQDAQHQGIQPSYPKTGNPDTFPNGRGPQGDVIRIYNFVRLVRDSK